MAHQRRKKGMRKNNKLFLKLQVDYRWQLSSLNSEPLSVVDVEVFHF